MKRIWVAIISLVVVITTGLFWCSYVERHVEQLRTQAEQTLQTMDAAPETALAQLEQISENWDKSEKTLDFIVMHDHIDEAKMALTKCRQYFAQEEYKLAQTELYLFSDILEEMADKEQLKLENIF